MRLLLPLLLALAACQADAPETDAEPDGLSSETTPRAIGTDDLGTADDLGAGDGADPAAKLNLNTATEDQLKALGVGDRMAHEFEEYRPYASVREFRQEIGKYIDDDPDQLAAYERMVYVPVDPNQSDAETLQQLPRVDAAAAQALIDGRPYASDDAFLDAYLVAAPTGDAAAARVYLGR